MNKIAVTLASAIALSMTILPARAADVIDTAENARSMQKFVAAMKSTGLAAELRKSGPYTVFAPSDEAVSKLPEGTWEALAKDKDRLEKIVASHIVPGKMLVTQVKPGDITTMEGHTIRLTSDNGMVTVNGAHITQSDLEADNGVIHEIDQVVLPE